MICSVLVNTAPGKKRPMVKPEKFSPYKTQRRIKPDTTFKGILKIMRDLPAVEG